VADTLRILHLEDDPVDGALVEETLLGDGLACETIRVASRQQFVAALDGSYDLILSDYSLPGFDGSTAQQLARERRPDLPFVFVSGTIGEEVAIERLKEGATDYVLKQRLARLPSAVRRALEEAGVELTRAPSCSFRDPWGNHVQVVDYREIQFAKTERVLRGMGLSLEKTDAALAELREKGLAD